MGNKTEEKVEERLSILETRANRNHKQILELANRDVARLNRLFTPLSLIGPVFISILYSVFTISFSAFVLWHLIVDVAATITLIVALLVLFSKLNIAQNVITKIETDKVDRQKRIESLEERICLLESDQSFYISATQLIGQTMKNGQADIESLAKVLVASIYHNLSRLSNGENITINLYELRNDTIKMILSTTRFQHCSRDNVDIPVLYQSVDGLDIKDNRIQDYYCIKCIRGKIKGRDGKYVLANWERIVQEFKWDGWTSTEKQKILNQHDHQKCIEQGFKYNQYLGFKIRRDDGIVVFLEIIANEHTTIAPTSEIDHVSHRLRETYSPLLSILWDISDI